MFHASLKGRSLMLNVAPIGLSEYEHRFAEYEYEYNFARSINARSLAVGYPGGAGVALPGEPQCRCRQHDSVPHRIHR